MRESSTASPASATLAALRIEADSPISIGPAAVGARPAAGPPQHGADAGDHLAGANGLTT